MKSTFANCVPNIFKMLKIPFSGTKLQPLKNPFVNRDRISSSVSVELGGKRRITERESLPYVTSRGFTVRKEEEARVEGERYGELV